MVPSRPIRPLLLVSLLLAAPSAALDCRLLPAAEAAAVIGPEPRLLTALEGGACQYGRGELTLDVIYPVIHDDAKLIAQTYAAMMAADHGTAIDGIGERAFVAKNNSGWRVIFVMGKTMAGTSVYGEGSDAPEMRERLVVAAKAIAGRL